MRRRDVGTIRREEAMKESVTFGAFRLSAFSILFVALFNFACTPRAFEKANVGASNTTTTNAPVETKPVTVEDEIEKLRTADLKFIYVFRRKDSTAFDSDDRSFLRTNLPFNNRVVRADEDRVVIVGSNYVFPAENLTYLRTRFNVEELASADKPAEENPKTEKPTAEKPK